MATVRTHCLEAFVPRIRLGRNGEPLKSQGNAGSVQRIGVFRFGSLSRTCLASTVAVSTRRYLAEDTLPKIQRQAYRARGTALEIPGAIAATTKTRGDQICSFHFPFWLKINARSASLFRPRSLIKIRRDKRVTSIFFIINWYFAF